MERRYVKDLKRSLELLGCTGVESLRVGTDHHVTALRPQGARVYLTTLDEASKLILALSRENPS